MSTIPLVQFNRGSQEYEIIYRNEILAAGFETRAEAEQFLDETFYTDERAA